MGFTIKSYKQLLTALQKQGFLFQTFQDYIHNKGDNKLILRHDVDKLPLNSLRFARIQSKMGIMGTYYFRIVPQSFDENIIKEIASLGHEVGYHYETMDTCKGDVDKAYDEFRRNLEKFRKITGIKTISMHGSPLSKYDNRVIWKKYDYKKLGIIGEPYFDLDFNEVFYITDTGRRWDGDRFNVRDKPMKEVGSREKGVGSKEYGVGRWPVYKTTKDIIKAVEAGTFPSKAMFNFHPQRWNDKPLPWVKELVWQNLKNQGKRVLVAVRG